MSDSQPPKPSAERLAEELKPSTPEDWAKRCGWVHTQEFRLVSERDLAKAFRAHEVEIRNAALEEVAKLSDGQCHLATDHPSIAHRIRVLKSQ